MLLNAMSRDVTFKVKKRLAGVHSEALQFEEGEGWAG
jgi:hypothetical protein